MAEKVLTHMDEESAEVHWVVGNFVAAEKTLCGERLQPIGSLHITNDKIPVTCTKCLGICEELIEIIDN